MGWWTRSVAPPEYDDWFSEDQPPKRIKPRTRDEIIREFKKNYPHRWWRLRRDYKWLRRRMVKMGLNPEDAAELLR